MDFVRGNFFKSIFVIKLISIGQMCIYINYKNKGIYIIILVMWIIEVFMSTKDKIKDIYANALVNIGQR